jgi:hypothetical protein
MVMMLFALLGSFFLPALAAAPSPPTYTHASGLSLATYTAVTYCLKGFPRPAYNVSGWECPFCFSNNSLTGLTVLYNESTDILGFAGYDPTQNRHIITFRGSESLTNWIENFDVEFLNLTCQNGVQCRVSDGFYRVAMGSILPQVLAYLHAALPAFPGSSISVSGHSLGAAIAECLAYVLNEQSFPVAELITFGKPRSGDSAWAASVREALPFQYRVTHAKDPVPHLPPEAVLDYMHPTTEVWYPSDTNNAQYKVCSATVGEDPTCSDSVFPDTVNDHHHYLGIYIDGCIP